MCIKKPNKQSTMVFSKYQIKGRDANFSGVQVKKEGVEELSLARVT